MIIIDWKDSYLKIAPFQRSNWTLCLLYSCTSLFCWLVFLFYEKRGFDSMKNLFDKFFECFRVQWPVLIMSISGILSVCCLTACFQVKAGKAVQYRNISEHFHITYLPSTSHDVFMWLTFHLILLWACFTKSSKSTLHIWWDHNCFSRANTIDCFIL